jgi:hypothetical protein
MERGSSGTRFLFHGVMESSCLVALFDKFKPRPATRLLLRHACCINCARTFLWKYADRQSQVLHHKFFIFDEDGFELV